MKKILVIIALISIAKSQASLVEIVDLYLNDSYDKKINLLQSEILEYNYRLVDNKDSWNFNLSNTQADTNTTSLFAFQARHTITNNKSFGFSKSFITGTSVDLTHSQTEYDLTNWSDEALFSLESDTLYEAKNILTLTQDLGKNFFGRNRRKELNQARLQQEVGEIQNQIETQQKLLQLYSLYINAKRTKTIVGLSKEALIRAQKRLAKTKKKLRDGNSRKVELYQSEMNEIMSKENLINSESSLIDLHQSIVTILDKNVSTESVVEYKFDESIINDFNSTEEKNHDLALISKRYMHLDNQREFSENDNFPDIKLIYQQTTNAFEESASEAVGEAGLNGERAEKVLKVSLSVPIGGSSKSVEQQRKRVELKKMLIEKKQISKTVNFKNKKFSNQIKKLKGLLSESYKKINLGKLAYNEQNRRYSKGQINLETLLRSEEEYIQAQMKYVQYAAEYEQIIGEKAFLVGQLNEYLKTYRE